jgi:AcrR family transcriptional regulator
MSFGILLQSFTRGQAAAGHPDGAFRALEPYLDGNPAGGFARLATPDGDADVFGIGSSGLMINRASGEFIWQLLIDVAVAGDYAIMPVGRPVCLVREDYRFTEAGYAGTTTLTVATQAGVSEALVIKHFGSKEGLYRQTVVEPLLRIVEEQIARNTPNPADPGYVDLAAAYRNTERFVRSWAEAIQQQRGLFLTLLTTMHQFPDALEQVLEPVETHVRALAATIDALVAGDQITRHDGRTAAFSAIGAATMGALFHDDLDRLAGEFTENYFFGVLTSEGRSRMEAVLDRHDEGNG